MTAKKCDRCGAFYEKEKQIPSALLLCCTDRGNGSISKNIKDLCPACYKELKEWFGEDKNKKSD